MGQGYPPEYQFDREWMGQLNSGCLKGAGGQGGQGGEKHTKGASFQAFMSVFSHSE